MTYQVIYDGLYLDITEPDGIAEDQSIVTKYKILVDGSVSVQTAKTTALAASFSGVCPKNVPDYTGQATIDLLLARIGMLKVLSIGGRSYAKACISAFEFQRSGELWNYTISFEEKTT
jgi:hypothetical protein